MEFYYDWELDLLHWFEGLHNPVLNPIMKFITTLGNVGMLWIAMAVVFLFFKKTRKTGICMGVSLILSLIFTNLLIKNIVDRTRPFVVDPTLLNHMLITLPTDASFPSGHTSASFAAAVAIFSQNKKWGIPALILAALIAISRLYLTVHFPTDVLAGLVLGILYGIGAYFITRFIFDKLSKKKSQAEV